MTNIEESDKQTNFSAYSVTVAELKSFLADNDLPTMGKKHKLQERVVNFLETEYLLHAIEAAAFVDLTVANTPMFGDLPVTVGNLEKLPALSEELVKKYLCKMGGYTKNYCTKACLTCSGHVLHIQRNKCPPFIYLKACCTL